MLEDELTGQRGRPPEVAETATKPSPAPLQKNSLDGCTIDRAVLAANLISVPVEQHIVSPLFG